MLFQAILTRLAPPHLFCTIVALFFPAGHSKRCYKPRKCALAFDPLRTPPTPRSSLLHLIRFLSRVSCSTFLTCLTLPSPFYSPPPSRPSVSIPPPPILPNHVIPHPTKLWIPPPVSLLFLSRPSVCLLLSPTTSTVSCRPSHSNSRRIAPSLAQRPSQEEPTFSHGTTQCPVLRKRVTPRPPQPLRPYRSTLTVSITDWRSAEIKDHRLSLTLSADQEIIIIRLGLRNHLASVRSCLLTWLSVTLDLLLSIIILLRLSCTPALSQLESAVCTSTCSPRFKPSLCCEKRRRWRRMKQCVCVCVSRTVGIVWRYAPLPRVEPLIYS